MRGNERLLLALCQYPPEDPLHLLPHRRQPVQVLLKDALEHGGKK